MTQKIRVADEKLGILLRREQDLNRRVLEGTLDISEVLAKLQKIIEGELENILSISSSLSLSERITLGKYGWVNPDITENNFPNKIEKDYKVECKLFHFNKSISSESVIAEMEKEGFKPANILELLKLGEIQPELQKQFPIVALGPAWRLADGSRFVPVLFFGDGRRGLNLYWFEDGWLGSYWFLGVRQAA
jgi:hypothetical protein